MSPKKELVIIAGPNGSGKTTFARAFIREKGYRFLNADEINKELQIENKNSNSIAAGKEYFKRIDLLLDKNKNLIIESTLSGKFIGRLIKRLERKNYNITIIFVYLDSPQLCIARIKERVKKGGHAVPDSDVTRRYFRSCSNFWNQYKNKAAQWLLLNNSGDQIKRIAEGSGRSMLVNDEALHVLFLKNTLSKK